MSDLLGCRVITVTDYSGEPYALQLLGTQQLLNLGNINISEIRDEKRAKRINI